MLGDEGDFRLKSLFCLRGPFAGFPSARGLGSSLLWLAAGALLVCLPQLWVPSPALWGFLLTGSYRSLVLYLLASLSPDW